MYDVFTHVVCTDEMPGQRFHCQDICIAQECLQESKYLGMRNWTFRWLVNTWMYSCDRRMDFRLKRSEMDGQNLEIILNSSS